MSDDTRLWVADLLAQFSGQGNTLVIPRAYIDVTGAIEDALLLSQIIYWTDRTKMEDGWFAKSYAEWESEIALSKYQVMSATKRLEEAGVETIVKKFNGSPTVHYHLRKSVFEQWIVKKLDERKLKNLTNDSQETKQSSTESTSKTTTKMTLDAQFDAIATTFKSKAGGHVANLRGMLFGSTKVKGEWLQYQINPPATLDEFKGFEGYIQERMRLQKLTDMPTKPETIERWYCDYREGLKEKAKPAPQSTPPVYKPSAKVQQREAEFQEWMKKGQPMNEEEF